jgi:hypothetical protein
MGLVAFKLYSKREEVYKEPEWDDDWMFARKYIIDILGSIYEPFLEITPRAPAFTPFL